MGYGRIDWKKAIPMMSNAYRNEWSIIQNLFSPQQQLVEKIREGSKVRWWMSEAMTPLERLGGYMPEEQHGRCNRFWIDSTVKTRLKHRLADLPEAIVHVRGGHLTSFISFNFISA
jgi:hypothetical protein